MFDHIFFQLYDSDTFFKDRRIKNYLPETSSKFFKEAHITREEFATILGRGSNKDFCKLQRAVPLNEFICRAGELFSKLLWSDVLVRENLGNCLEVLASEIHPSIKNKQEIAKAFYQNLIDFSSYWEDLKGFSLKGARRDYWVQPLCITNEDDEAGDKWETSVIWDSCDDSSAAPVVALKIKDDQWYFSEMPYEFFYHTSPEILETFGKKESVKTKEEVIDILDNADYVQNERLVSRRWSAFYWLLCCGLQREIRHDNYTCSEYIEILDRFPWIRKIPQFDRKGRMSTLAAARLLLE